MNPASTGFPVGKGWQGCHFSVMMIKVILSLPM
jgi:hypothetical protein